MGASEIFVDGVLVKSFGIVGASAETEQGYNPNETKFRVALDSAGDHTIAVRHSCAALADANAGWSKFLNDHDSQNLGIGFDLRVSKLDSYLSETDSIIQKRFGDGRAVGLFVAVGILFLLIYGFYPREKTYLFFSLFILSFGFYIHARGVIAASHADIADIAALGQLINVLIVAQNVAFLAFLYVTLADVIPRRFWIFLTVSGLWLIAGLAFPNSNMSVILNVLIGFFTIIESLRLAVQALRKGVDGAWIIGIGVLLQASALTRAMSGLLGFPFPQNVTDIMRNITNYGLVIVISIFLARRFARTNKSLETELERVKELSEKELQYERDKVEFERRAKELEEARQLQLSMLPKKMPNIAGLEIAAYMKPATEVGGDYYDFHVEADGTLTVAVGDATGHGLKAGTVVTATKSLFNNLANASDIPDTLRQISRSLKAMNLRGLFMALTLIKLKDNNLSVGAAGMPSTLVYRAATETVEEISIRAVPLGSMTNFKYQGQEIALQTGDCVVVMSDGFPEMFNPSGEMLGFDKAAEVLKEVAAQTPQEIIDRFVEVSNSWAGARPADDDVTFVVLKVV